jgi:hypothetical protein
LRQAARIRKHTAAASQPQIAPFGGFGDEAPSVSSEVALTETRRSHVTVASKRGRKARKGRPGPAPSITIFSQNTFVVGGTGSGLANATVQLELNVLATAKSITGTAIVPTGATATAQVQATGKSFPISNGSVRIPLT